MKRTMNDLQKYLSTCLLATTALLGGASPAFAVSSAPSLATAANFAVLGSAVTCTNTPPTTITGDVGVVLSTGFTNTTGCKIAGTVHAGDAAALAAYKAFLSAYVALAPKSGDCDSAHTLAGTLAGKNLAPGVYCVAAGAKTGTLTLTGPANGTWTFKVAPGALTGTNFSVIMAGGGQPCNVTWRVDAAATMTGSVFQGNILAAADITLTGGTLAGRALAGGTGSTSVSKGAVTITGTKVISCPR
jgi:ice-binding like protein